MVGNTSETMAGEYQDYPVPNQYYDQQNYDHQYDYPSYDQAYYNGDCSNSCDYYNNQATPAPPPYVMQQCHYEKISYEAQYYGNFSAHWWAR